MKKSPLRKAYPRITERFKTNSKTGTVTTFYQVDCRGHGWEGEQQPQFPTAAEAIEKAQTVAKLIAEHGKAGIHHEDVKLLARVRRKLTPFHLGLEEAIDLFVQSRATSIAIQKSEPLSKVTAMYLASKSSGNRPLEKDTLRGIKNTINRLKECFQDVPIGSITKEMVDTALEENYETNNTRLDYLKRFRSFFKYAKKQKYIKTNPCDDIDIYATKGRTLVFSDDDTINFLNNLLSEPELIPYITLCLFAGIRPTECVKLEWRDINFERKQVYIPAEISKVGTDRYTPMSDNLMEWLKPYVGKPIKIKNHRKTLDRVKKGIVWQKDILRHTAISHFMGRKDSTIYNVSEMLGNSPAVIKKHYQRAVLPHENDLFWSLTPDKVKQLIKERKENSIDV